MKTDLASLKKEFKRLTDVDELKKELNRLATEIRGFDLSSAIPTAQRQRLEKRYRELKKTLADLQKRLDSSFAKVTSYVRKSGLGKTTSAKKSSSKKAKAPARKKVSKKKIARKAK